MTQPPSTNTGPAAAITHKACNGLRTYVQINPYILPPQFVMPAIKYNDVRINDLSLSVTAYLRISMGRHTCWPPAAAVRAAAICVLLLLPAAAAQAPVEAAAAIEAQGDGNGTTRGGGGGSGSGARGGGGGGGGGTRKLVSGIDCQICEATCRVKCLINNLFQWGGCYQRCKTDNCNDWCR